MNRAASSRPSGPAANSRFAEKETGDSVRRRDEYFLRKRGLIFGVPPAAYAKAMEHMRAMRRRRFNSASPGAEESAAIWNFIGPQPIIQFSPLNPTGTGRLTAVAVDPNVNNRVIVGAANGGVWLSNDDGNTFTPIFDSQPTLAIGSIALDPGTNPTTIYVGTGEGNTSADSYYGQGIFRSTDLGMTWEQLGKTSFANYAIGALAIDTSVTPRILFAAVTEGLSDTRGEADYDESTIKAGLFKSTDAGATWSRFDASAFGLEAGYYYAMDDVAIDPSSDRRIYVAGAGGAFASTDGGNTWSSINFPGLSSGSAGRVKIAVSQSGTVYLMVGEAQDLSDGAVSFLGFYKSTDFGNSWATETVPCENGIDGTPTGAGSACGASYYAQSWYDQALLVDPRDPSDNTVVFGGVELYISH
ncbi:MAG TPA: hypothetical protein VMT64_00650, partial [Candidatus Binataceae bacterium]|nr:hypothetical protein [Candidatus Binataceae bacterium]